ncbi:MAG: hypothetical protein OEW42_15595 [Acidimicrobiia bacterium]|nr:hypothetical protein [Acidimicrobiia bacterium]MDH5236657.1 hypothetical protein [Acidimicrobiia bacterium]
MFSHLLVPIAHHADTARAVFPAAAMARAFEATVVVVTHPSAGIDPEDLVARVGTADIAAVRLDDDDDVVSALSRVADPTGNALVVCTGALATSLLEGWKGPLLIFGGGTDPDSYSVGGTILVDAAVHARRDDELIELGRAFGFAFEPVDDVTTAIGSPGQVIVVRRSQTDHVDQLVARWPGPIYLLGG